MKKLTRLYCHHCISLTHIHMISNLERLYCFNCPLLISIPKSIFTIKSYCKWLHCKASQLNKLIKAQRIVKRYLNRKKFITRLELNKYLPLVIINIIATPIKLHK